jgi:hypothetical protein
MAGEMQRVYGSSVTLEANGASIATGAIGEANDANYDLSDDTPADYPDAEFVLTCAFGGTPTAGTAISLIIRPLDIDGTTDAPAPTATYLHEFFGSFVHNGASSSQTLRCHARDIPRAGTAYLFNSGTGQTLSAGWVLKVRPISYKLAA